MKWNYIGDKQPDIMETVIFWHPENGEVKVGTAMPDGVHILGYPYPCSHWMYLPKPPNLTSK